MNEVLRESAMTTKTYAIGDVHGCLDQLQWLIELCWRDAAFVKAKFIFLGDYIDRGADSRGVVDFLIHLQKCSPDEAICLRGNHEDLLLAALDSEDAELNWLSKGGDKTLSSYRVSRAKELPTPHIDWIRSLSLFHNDGSLFTRAYIDRPLNRQRSRDLLWIRESFLSSDQNYGTLIVHGHTPICGKPDLRFNRLDIDTGAVYGRALTAAVFPEQHVAPSSFIQAD